MTDDEWKIQHIVDTPEAAAERFKDIYGDSAILVTETMTLAEYKARFGQGVPEEQNDESLFIVPLWLPRPR